MCFGTFDKLHPGHEFYLRASKELGDYLVVIVARDKNVLKIKNKLPSQTEVVRLENLKKLSFVDQVELGEENKRLLVIEKYNPDILCFGYDQQVDETAVRKIFSGVIVRQKSYRPEIYKSSKIITE